MSSEQLLRGIIDAIKECSFCVYFSKKGRKGESGEALSSDLIRVHYTCKSDGKRKLLVFMGNVR